MSDNPQENSQPKQLSPVEQAMELRRKKQAQAQKTASQAGQTAGEPAGAGQAPAPQKAKPTRPTGKAPQSRAAAKKVRPKSKPQASSNAGPTADNNPDLSQLGKVMVRNEFYRDGYRMLLKIAVLEAFVIVGLIFAMLFLIHSHQPENRYFATTEDGRLMPMIPLSEPNLSTPALMSWVAQAATETMTFGFNDYRRRLQEASRHFTRTGWDSYTHALQSSGIMDAVEANRQVVTAAPQGAPVIIEESVVLGRYQWIVQLPMTLTYEAGSKRRSDSWLVTVVVVRMPRLETSNGVGIEQWIAVPR